MVVVPVDKSTLEVSEGSSSSMFVISQPGGTNSVTV
jgi:hypothetical protein